MEDTIKGIFANHRTIINSMVTDQKIMYDLMLVAHKCIEVFKKDAKVLFCGNGGSAADAQHLASELSGKFYLDREPLFAEALHVNSSYLTAVSNDYGFEHSFSRLIKAKAKKGDVLIGLSTSGNSPNVLKAFEQANKQGVFTIAFTGEGGGKLAELSDIVLKVPSDDTPRIQEMHILLGHILCELVEKSLFE